MGRVNSIIALLQHMAKTLPIVSKGRTLSFVAEPTPASRATHAALADTLLFRHGTDHSKLMSPAGLGDLTEDECAQLADQYNAVLLGTAAAIRAAEWEVSSAGGFTHAFVTLEHKTFLPGSYLIRQAFNLSGLREQGFNMYRETLGAAIGRHHSHQPKKIEENKALLDKFSSSLSAFEGPLQQQFQPKDITSPTNSLCITRASIPGITLREASENPPVTTDKTSSGAVAKLHKPK